MGHLIRMPALGLEMARGTILEWTVDEGESVSAGDRVAAVEAEPTTGTAIAREGGVLRRRLVAEGTSLPPGAPIAIVAAPDRDVSDLEAEAKAALGDVADDGNESTNGDVLEDGRGRPHENGCRALDERAEPTARGDARDPMPGRTVTASTADGLCGRIDAGAFEWVYDEPADHGGTETGPTPVDVFLGGLAACLSLSVRFQADKRETPVGEISVTADATPDHGPVKTLEATVRLETDAADDTVDRIVDLAERGCHVSQLLREDLEVELSWVRR